MERQLTENIPLSTIGFEEATVVSVVDSRKITNLSQRKLISFQVLFGGIIFRLPLNMKYSI